MKKDDLVIAEPGTYRVYIAKKPSRQSFAWRDMGFVEFQLDDDGGVVSTFTNYEPPKSWMRRIFEAAIAALILAEVRYTEEKTVVLRHGQRHQFSDDTEEAAE